MSKLSIFTPSHDPQHLGELYASLKQQSDAHWQWVVCPNGPHAQAVEDVLKQFADPRIKIVPVPGYIPATVGALKRFACAHCDGLLFIEVDHDDWLAPDAIRLLRQTWHETAAGFLYSECVGVRADGQPVMYDSSFGWKYGVHRYKSRDHVVNLNFPVSPRSLCEIYYAPNHMRAWSREAYLQVGGHAASLALCDDQDLMCRTYLAGVKMALVPGVQYYQRCHAESTSTVRWKEIRELSAGLKDKYLEPMVREWCRREGLAMLDLGGAHNCPKELGYLSVDRSNADILCDVTQDIPYPDGKVGVFRAADFLEHVPIGQVVPLMNRLYDKLAPGGWLLSTTPAVSDADGRVGRGAFQDPTHCSFWSENNTWYFTERKLAQYVPELRCRFQNARLQTVYPSAWHREHSIPYLIWDAMALKGEAPVPGGCLI
jgi:hypothetical protein